MTDQDERPEPKFTETDLVVYYHQNDPKPHFCLLTQPRWHGDHGWRYWVTYIQTPSMGYPSGGASSCGEEDRFHLPETAYEQLLAMQYHARAKALAAAEALTQAEKEADAIDLTLKVFLSFGRNGGVR